MRSCKVFVHLAQNKDARIWESKFYSGSLVGVNDKTPYGYGRAEQYGFSIEFSKIGDTGFISNVARIFLRVVLGFDFIHAWRNRQAMRGADVIWTHTESQYLAVAAVQMMMGSNVPVIGQSVWIFDQWPRLSFIKKIFYKALMRKIRVLTCHSPVNVAFAKSLLPHADIRLVPFGIASETKIPPRRRDQRPVRVLAVGNDKHRDWITLAQAVDGQDEMLLLVLSQTFPKRLLRDAGNIEARSARSNAELTEAYQGATVVCVPLSTNLHASGITVIQEAVLAGVPVIATDTGGLRDYFTEDEIRYVPIGDARALRHAISEIAGKPEEVVAAANRAQKRMGKDGDLGLDQYIMHHVDITKQILEHRT